VRPTLRDSINIYRPGGDGWRSDGFAARKRRLLPVVQAMRVAGGVVFWPLISRTYELRSAAANRQPGLARVSTERRRGSGGRAAKNFGCPRLL
jgi:hypothetical protein